MAPEAARAEAQPARACLTIVTRMKRMKGDDENRPGEEDRLPGAAEGAGTSSRPAMRRGGSIAAR